jgi:hypothetical protein
VAARLCAITSPGGAGTGCAVAVQLAHSNAISDRFIARNVAACRSDVM